MFGNGWEGMDGRYLRAHTYVQHKGQKKPSQKKPSQAKREKQDFFFFCVCLHEMQERHDFNHHASVASLEGTSAEGVDQLGDHTRDKEHGDTIGTQCLKWSNVQWENNHSYDTKTRKKKRERLSSASTAITSIHLFQKQRVWVILSFRKIKLQTLKM